MKSLTVIFLIALLGASFAIKSAPSPAQLVLDKVDALVTGANNEQVAQSQIYASQHQRCVDEKHYREQEIQDGSVAAGAASQQLGQCKAEKPVAETSHAQAQSELVLTEQQLASLQEEHKQFVAANNERITEHQDALNNIQTAYNIIGNFANGKQALESSSFFLQVTQHLNKVFKTAIKHRFHKSMSPVMTALVQMTQTPATTVSTSSLQKVVGLFRQLEQSVKDSDARRAAEFQAYEDSFNHQVQLLNAQVSGLKSIIAAYENYLDSLRSCIAREQAVLDLADAKVNRNTNILNASDEMCKAYTRQYDTQSAERAAYVELLGKLRSFVVSAIANFNSGLYEQGDFVHTL